MDTHGPPQGDATSGSSGWRNRRKRIVAREVRADELPAAETTAAAAADVECETRLAARDAIVPGELVDAPYAPPAQVDSLIVDPTQLVGERHRHHGAHVKYRATQLSTGLSMVGAVVAIAMVFDDESTVAQVLAGVALVLALVGVYLVRTSRLAYRLRGYAAAAGVLAAIATAFSLVPNPFHEEPALNPPVSRPDASPTP